MSAERHYVRVGAFALGGIALAVATVVVVAGGRLFQHPTIMETVFEESVQGLEVGSPVKLRGVKLGTVKWIGFVNDVYSMENSPDPVDEGNRVLVRMEIGDEDVPEEERASSLKKLVEKGLRLRLTPLGITGTSFIQADYLDPDKNPPMHLSYKPRYLYVPSAPSTITQISSAAERLMTRIDRLDVEGLLTNLDELLVNVNGVVEKLDVGDAQSRVAGLLDDLRDTTREIRGAVAGARVDTVSQDLRGTIQEANRTLAQLQELLARGSEDLETTLENLRVASQNLRDASETARSYPSYLILGNPPKPVERPPRKTAP